ncbi:hypothetical protein ACJRO0_12160 [Acetobacter oryzifermentans]
MTEPFSASDLEWYEGRHLRLLAEGALKDGECIPPILAKPYGNGNPNENSFVAAYNLNAYTPEHNEIALRLFGEE